MCFDKRITKFFIHEYIQFNQIIFVKLILLRKQRRLPRHNMASINILEKFLVLIQLDLTFEEYYHHHHISMVSYCFKQIELVLFLCGDVIETWKYFTYE